MTARMETTDTTVVYRSDDYPSNGGARAALAVDGDKYVVRVGFDWFFDVDQVEVTSSEARRMALALTMAADIIERGTWVPA